MQKHRLKENEAGQTPWKEWKQSTEKTRKKSSKRGWTGSRKSAPHRHSADFLTWSDFGLVSTAVFLNWTDSCMTIHKWIRLFSKIQRATRTAKDIGQVKSNARFAISPVASVRAVSTYPDPNHSCVGVSLLRSLASCSAESRTGKTIRNQTPERALAVSNWEETWAYFQRGRNQSKRKESRCRWAVREWAHLNRNYLLFPLSVLGTHGIRHHAKHLHHLLVLGGPNDSLYSTRSAIKNQRILSKLSKDTKQQWKGAIGAIFCLFA